MVYRNHRRSNMVCLTINDHDIFSINLRKICFRSLESPTDAIDFELMMCEGEFLEVHKGLISRHECKCPSIHCVQFMYSKRSLILI